MASLPKNIDTNLLVGFETSDDAGIYKLSDDIAIVTTADYITPPVNDPYIFGQIAAANSISDIYAMGGKPVTCLNLVCFPPKKLESNILHQIISGGLSKITEADAVLAGGHSVEDDEPKYGLSVTGIVHPGKYWSNAGAQPGDILILTKPIGSGVLLNANIKKWVSKTAMDECIETLTRLNKIPAEIMTDFDIHAATDITGFGIAGHCFEMAMASNMCLEISINELPLMKEALDMYKKGMNTGVNAFNRQLVSNHARFDIDLPLWHQEIVFDPQTNGGLLMAVPEVQSKTLLQHLISAGVSNSKIIGKVSEHEKPYYLIFK